MDYSHLVGIHFRDDDSASKISLSRSESCPKFVGKPEPFLGGKDTAEFRVPEFGLQEMDEIIDSRSSLNPKDVEYKEYHGVCKEVTQSVYSFGKRSSRSSSCRWESIADDYDACNTRTPIVACKGHLFVYTIEGKRSMIPLEYLKSNIFQELLKLSEDEFGLQRDGPVMLPCDAPCLEYIISMVHCRVSTDVKRALLASIAKESRCMGTFSDQHGHEFH